MATPMELNVPRGMDLRGFISSPDMLDPAMMPVTAGKKIAKEAPVLKIAEQRYFRIGVVRS